MFKCLQNLRCFFNYLLPFTLACFSTCIVAAQSLYPLFPGFVTVQHKTVYPSISHHTTNLSSTSLSSHFTGPVSIYSWCTVHTPLTGTEMSTAVTKETSCIPDSSSTSVASHVALYKCDYLHYHYYYYFSTLASKGPRVKKKRKKLLSDIGWKI